MTMDSLGSLPVKLVPHYVQKKSLSYYHKKITIWRDGKERPGPPRLYVAYVTKLQSITWRMVFLLVGWLLSCLAPTQDPINKLTSFLYARVNTWSRICVHMWCPRATSWHPGRFFFCLLGYAIRRACLHIYVRSLFFS